MFSKCTLPKNFSELSAINFPTNYIMNTLTNFLCKNYINYIYIYIYIYSKD